MCASLDRDTFCEVSRPVNVPPERVSSEVCEELEENGETPSAIIPNVGRPVLSYAGIVGLAVVVRKNGRTS